jgi:Flp pilus assembly protein TadG
VSASPARSRRRLASSLLGERGAAAVEFALVVPLLLMLLVGIVEFSKAFNAQATLSAAAREAARTMTLANDVTQARTAAQTAAGALGLSSTAVSITPATCAADGSTTVKVTITYHQTFVAGLLGTTGVDLTGTAAMRCAR